MKEGIYVIVMYYCVLRICCIIGTWTKTWNKKKGTK